MKRKFKLFDSVVPTRDLDEHSDAAVSPGRFIPCGSHGVIVDLLIKDGVAVEFFDDEGKTIDVAFISESLVREPTALESKAIRALNERLSREPIHDVSL